MVAWLRERVLASTEREIAVLLEQSDTMRADSLRRAVRQTVERQTVALGTDQFNVRVVAVPITVSRALPLDNQMLRVNHLIVPMQAMLASEGLIPSKGGGITMLTRLVTHGQLRQLSYAKMFEISRRIFHSAVVSSAHRQVVEGLRGDDFSGTELCDGGSMFTGYLVGCIYAKAGTGHAARNDNLVAVHRQMGELVRAHFASLETTSTVEVGNISSLYDAMDEGSCQRVRLLVSSMIDFVEGFDWVVRTTYEADATNPQNVVLRVEFNQRSDGGTLVQAALSLNPVEQGALDRVHHELNDLLGSARTSATTGCFH